jgi:hypothetical protein
MTIDKIALETLSAEKKNKIQNWQSSMHKLHILQRANKHFNFCWKKYCWLYADFLIVLAVMPGFSTQLSGKGN